MPKNRFEELMHYVCVGHGYCGSVINGHPTHVTDFIPDFGYVSATEFAEWVMLADDCPPESTVTFRERHKRDMEVAFIKYMRAEVVPARDLSWEAES